MIISLLTKILIINKKNTFWRRAKIGDGANSTESINSTITQPAREHKLVQERTKCSCSR